MRGLYDPQLIPERKVLEAKQQLIEENRGTNALYRSGEEYFAFCECEAVLVTSNWNTVRYFLETPHTHFVPDGGLV